MKKILVVEDEDTIRDFIVINLNRAGYDVSECSCGEDALKLYNEGPHFDVVILDVMLPGINGISVFKEIRKLSSEVGIIILSAKAQEIDKVTGLMVGADDYVSKPFSPSELVARVDSVYRRVAISNTRKENNFKEKIKLGDFTLNIKNRSLTKNSNIIELTQVEFQILEYFFSNPNTPLSRSSILKRVWGEHNESDEKIVDVNIRRLRMKVEDNPSYPKHIVTVWGLGYQWNE